MKHWLFMRKRYTACIITVFTSFFLFCIVEFLSKRYARKRKHNFNLAKQSQVLPCGARKFNYPESAICGQSCSVEKLTILDAFLAGKEVSNDGECLGYLDAKCTKYIWLTYSQVIDKANSLGSGLMKVCQGFQENKLIGIHMKNCVEWSLCELAAYMFSLVPVPIYSSFDIVKCIYIINECKLRLVVCDSSQRVNQLLQYAENVSCLKVIILKGNQYTFDFSKNYPIKVFRFSEVEELGEKDLIKPRPSKSDDLMTICYTSGTTAEKLKGAMITHKNVLSCIHSLCELNAGKRQKFTHLSFLPLAHMAERSLIPYICYNGGRVAFYSGNMNNFQRDIKLAAPDIVFLVPRLLHKFEEKLKLRLEENFFKNFFFHFILCTKLKLIKLGFMDVRSFLDFVFAQARDVLGGNVKVAFCGSASISASLLTKWRCILGCDILHGYGVTESCPAITLSLPGDVIDSAVGPPMLHNQVKLIDVCEEDLQYTASEGQGEICFKGDNVFRGYFNDEVLTRKTIDGDGWVHTGDVGEWLSNGALRIIDRKKNIFKSAHGEFVSSERIENIYAKSNYVNQILVCNNNDASALIALIFPNFDMSVIKPYQHSLYDKNSFGYQTVKEIVFKDMIACEDLDGEKLLGYERVKDIILVPMEISVENGLLTPTFKMKRFLIKNIYKREIMALSI